MHEFRAGQLAGDYQNDDHLSLFARFLSLAQSHHEAIMLLCYGERSMGFAFALLRPLVEASYRGSFVAFLATLEQIEQIKRGETPYGNAGKAYSGPNVPDCPGESLNTVIPTCRDPSG